MYRICEYFMGAACNVKRYLNRLALQMRQTALSPASGLRAVHFPDLGVVGQ